MSIVTKGLGGSATNLMVGHYRLGFLEIDVVVGSPGLEGGASKPKRNWIYRPPWGTDWVAPLPRYDVLHLTVRFQGREWRKRLIVSEKIRDNIVIVISTFRTVAKKMKAMVGGIVERVKKFSVKVKRR